MLRIKSYNLSAFVFFTIMIMQVGALISSRINIIIVGLFLSSFLLYLAKANLKLEKKILVFIAIFFSEALVSLLNFQDYILLIRILMCLVVFILSYEFFNNKDSYRNNKNVELIVILSIIFLSLELYFRIGSVRGLISVFNSNYYILKTNSIVFNDSNTTGIFICCIISIYISKCTRCKWYYISPLIFFLFFTLSRSAILSVVIFFSVLYFTGVKNINRIILVFSMLIIIPFLTLFLYPYITIDNSANSRLIVYENIWSVMQGEGIYSLLFGKGEIEGASLYSYEEGVSSHALIPVLLGYFGIFGTLLFFIKFIPIYIGSKSRYYTSLCCMLFTLGIFFIPPYFEIIYMALGVAASKDKLNNEV